MPAPTIATGDGMIDEDPTPASYVNDGATKVEPEARCTLWRPLPLRGPLRERVD
jgi:hypothetical protein